MTDLIATRHPHLHRLIEAWRTHGGVVPAEALRGREAPVAWLRLEDPGGWRIDAADARLAELYGGAFVGESARALSAGEEAAACEAQAADETGREILVEATLSLAGRRVRLARLYLPLAAGEVLCAVATVA
ncbi:MAG: hypothetical protein Q8Q88_06300 [Phenylobacterium sp.]|uniref:hypothetical protein n=1 Tax=Phenylobacterium sp. TaxID=1871053 RepID=UPI002732FB15|nr:hypothetical protein [Phenylobacterium sp.]MDP3746645.1 hypothetical protein [Phenylobacterium sp.]